MSASDQTAQDGNKNIEFVTLFLTVLTITLTVTGLILAVWGVETLSKVEEMIDERLSRQMNEKSHELTNEFVRQTNDMNQFMRDMLAASIAEFDRRRESLPKNHPITDIPDSAVQQNINNWQIELSDIKWSRYTPKQDIKAKIQQVYTLFTKIAATHVKYDALIRLTLVEIYYGHLHRYTANQKLTEADHKQVLTELNKYFDLNKIRRYPNRFDQARLWQLRSQVEFNLGEKKQAIQSIQNALNLARLNQYLYDYLSYIQGDQGYATQQNDLIRAILLASLHHKSGELEKLHENKRKLIRKYPAIQSDILRASDKIEFYFTGVPEYENK
ncbi:MAG: hypothetical protein AAFP10_07720 [Pseudomonadota bacterium]